MKKLTFSILILSALLTNAQDGVYYYYKSEKIYLGKNDSVKIIQFSNERTARNSPVLNQLRSQNIIIDTLDAFSYRVSGDFNRLTKSDMSSIKRQDTNIVYISDVLTYNGSMLWETEKMIVKIFPETELSEVLEKSRIPYKEYKRLGSNPQTYIIELDVSVQSALEWSNMLVENQYRVKKYKKLYTNSQYNTILT